MRFLLTEVGLRLLTDEIIETLRPILKDFRIPDWIHGGSGETKEAGEVENLDEGSEEAGRSDENDPLVAAAAAASKLATDKKTWREVEASLQEIRLSVDFVDSKAAVMENHVLWRIKANVQVQADYDYKMRYIGGLNRK